MRHRSIFRLVRHIQYQNEQIPTDIIIDLMIRISAMQLPVPGSARPTQVVLPDGLFHPKFQARKAGFGNYVYCRKEAFETLLDRGKYLLIGNLEPILSYPTRRFLQANVDKRCHVSQHH